MRYVALTFTLAALLVACNKSDTVQARDEQKKERMERLYSGDAGDIYCIDGYKWLHNRWKGSSEQMMVRSTVGALPALCDD